jgi:hypothetical protein
MKEKKIDHLKTLTKVSSATLAANNLYTLDENILEIVLQKEAAYIASRNATEERKTVAIKKQPFTKTQSTVIGFTSQSAELHLAEVPLLARDSSEKM